MITDTKGNRLFPILPMRDRGVRGYVPWAKIASHESQAQKNHYQSLELLASRGGLSMSELAAVLEDRPWCTMNRDDALAAVERAIGEQITV